jgi:hypothetical protein
VAGHERAREGDVEALRIDPGRGGAEEAQQRLRGHLGDHHRAVAVEPVAVLGQQTGAPVRRAQDALGERWRQAVDAHAPLEGDVARAVLQGGQQRTVRQRLEAGRATAHDAGLLGVRPEHGEAGPGGERQHGPLVAAQHGGRGRRAPAQRPLVGVVDGLLRLLAVALGRPHALHQPEQVSHLVVDQGFVRVAGLDRRPQRLAVDGLGAGHRHGEPGPDGRDGVVGAEPVRHDEAVEAPLVAQDAGEQTMVAGGVLAGHLVVGAHDPPGAGVSHRGFEGAQVQLAQHPIVDVDVHGHAVDLGVVRDVVLDGHRDVVGLDGPDQGHGQAGGELGILAHALEHPPAHRGALQVHRGGEQHVGALAT